MPGSTPVYHWPYPIGTDPLDDAVSTIPQSMATAMETTLQAFGGIANPGAWAAVPGFTGAAVGGFGAVRYRKAGVWVELRGLATWAGGITAGAVIGTLPVNNRPINPELWNVWRDGNVPVRMDINSAGQLIIANAQAAGVILSMSNVRIAVD